MIRVAYKTLSTETHGEKTMYRSLATSPLVPEYTFGMSYFSQSMADYDAVVRIIAKILHCDSVTDVLNVVAHPVEFLEPHYRYTLVDIEADIQ